MQRSTQMTMGVATLDATLNGGDVARLRRMKLTATGFLVAAAALYVATFAFHHGNDGVLGFVRAGSEAAMVGGLADWFAVTALFRRPLHLPIPHTAIIPQKKDEIATKLGTFVTENFLTPELMAGRLADVHVVARLGEWLREPVNSDRLGIEAARLASEALKEIDTQWLVTFGFDVARRDLARRSYAPLLGQLLSHALAADVPQPLLERVAAFAAAYIRANRETVRGQLNAFVEDRNWVVRLVTTDKRIDRVIDGALYELDGVQYDPNHWLRVSLDGLLRDFADKLQTDAETAETLDAAVRHFLTDERYQQLALTFTAGFAESVRDSLDAEEGGLAPQVAQFISRQGTRIVTDTELQATLELLLQRAVVHAIREYGDEFTVLIQQTVAGWNPTSAARRIEVAVGRDLQFIRINGTVVGALAGLTIHLVTLAL
jgi:uncharacterized membrane-anchored protein YjiN (DUF445 family)